MPYKLTVSKHLTILFSLVLLHFLFLLGSQHVAGQSPFVFNHLTVENGLSSASVLSITQDQKGFLWVGTMDGLNRYDGKKIKVFKSFYRTNLIGPRIKIGRVLADKQQNIWIGTNNGLYVYDIRLDSFRVFFHSEKNTTSISNNNIKALYMDKGGNIWVGTQNGLNKITGTTNFGFERMPLVYQNDSLSFNDVQCIFENSSGNILVGTPKGILILPGNSPDAKTGNSPILSLPGIPITSMAEDKTETIWIGTNGMGLYKMNQSGLIENNYSHQANKANSLVNNIIRKIIVDREGRVWMGTLKGLSVLYPASGNFETYVSKAENAQTLNFNSIYDLFEDKQGTIWIGTYFGGLNSVETVRTLFKVYQNAENGASISSNIISAIMGDESDNLWVGTEAEGLNYFDRKNQVFKRFKAHETQSASLSSNLIKSLARDGENHIWVGMYNGSVDIIDNSGRKIQRLTNKGPNAINSDDVMALLYDHNGRMWIGTEEHGINIYDFKTKRVEKFESVYPGRTLAGRGITCFFEDSKKNMWIGTAQGLSMLEFSSERMHSFYLKDITGQLPSDFVNCVTEDNKGFIWVGTYSGLSVYSPTGKNFSRLSSKNGLAGNKIVGIITDNKNNLWVSTDNGISRIDSSRKQIHSYNIDDGLPGNVFNYRSVFKDKKGNLFFGGYNGLVEVNPEEIKTNTLPPGILFTGLNINGKTIHTRDGSGLLTKDISETNELDLKYDQNVITIDYAVMNFIKPGKNVSAYKLEGYNFNWVYNNTHSASFVNLPPGKYPLFIKACNNDGVCGPAQQMLQINISPPPWKSLWAYSLYTIFLLAIIVGIIYFFISRAALKRKIQYEQMMNAKQQELHQMKMDFFTHVSHEIRTPLTLITGPAEMLMSKVQGSEKKLVQTIQTNTERLLKLTTDLLDFRKADSGYTQLKMKAGNIVEFSRSVYSKFVAAAAAKSIALEFNSSEDLIETYFDADHMEIVLSNLLSNAIKFTNEKGLIEMNIERKDHDIEIRVCDNGIGVPKENQENIFKNFYQGYGTGTKTVGSGIGLAFSKSLVELHHGQLSFYSTSDEDSGLKETCFIVMLPLGKDPFNDSSINLQDQNFK